jgi:hypothetical protein
MNAPIVNLSGARKVNGTSMKIYIARDRGRAVAATPYTVNYIFMPGIYKSLENEKAHNNIGGRASDLRRQAAIFILMAISIR